MTDKDKMIDELAQDICNGCQTRISEKNLSRCSGKGCTMALIVGEYLVNKNYRKIPDGAVVLTKESQIADIKALNIHIDKVREKVRKETAKEIYVLARQFASQAAFPEGMFHKFIKEIKDRYGIEVEE